jgi:hypothetical protein
MARKVVKEIFSESQISAAPVEPHARLTSGLGFGFASLS